MNILFLLSDQHEARTLGCAGNELVQTPNLDRLASQGVLFDNAYCNNPLSCPSRCSLITGRYSRDIGIYENQDILEPYSVTFPRILNAAGYRTCLIGKHHFNGEQFHGFRDRPYGDFFGQAHQPDPPRDLKAGGSGLGGLVDNTGPTGIPLPLTQTEICVAEAAKWLQIHTEISPQQPFCLCVNFDKPHFPMRAPAHLFEKYDGKVPVPKLPPGYYERAVPIVRRAMDVFGQSQKNEARALAAYYACIEWVDDAVGRLLGVLDYLGLRQDTLVIYSSDHGELGGDHGAWNKSLFFESSARVPLIIAGPQVRQAGTTCRAPASLVDLFPTFCEAANTPAPADCSGQSLLPLLDGRESTWTRDEIYSETVFYGVPELAGCMIRSGQWKYCYYLDGSEELYNLESDPGEWNNLAKDTNQVAVAEELRRKVVNFWEPEKQLDRVRNTPKVRLHKHNYPWSNQFLCGNGTIVDAKP
jgi:choline-sulfatase